MTVNVLDVAPAGTVTLAGTVATFVFALASLTTTPSEPAGASRVTVEPEMLAPLLTVAGLKVTALMATGWTVTLSDLEPPP